MEPREYLPAYLERVYRRNHPDLTPSALELLHDDISQRPEKYAAEAHAQAYVAYAHAHEHLMSELDRLEDIPDDEEFERGRGRLFDETRLALFKIAETDRLCIDARLVGIMLTDIPLDSCLGELMELEKEAVDYLSGSVPGFDMEAEHYWVCSALDAEHTPASLTLSEPIMIGWLHTLEAISQLSLASARYRAAISYAQRVLRAKGYRTRAVGTELLALARLEDEDGFFELVRSYTDPQSERNLLEDSPWYLLARTLLLYKTGKRKPAKRALRDFVSRCEGAAFFLLNPTYLAPYLPVRPAPRDPWDLAHQAIWEADAIIVDTPDFAAWAESVDGVTDLSEAFARRNGF